MGSGIVASKKSFQAGPEAERGCAGSFCSEKMIFIIQFEKEQQAAKSMGEYLTLIVYGTYVDGWNHLES